MSTSSKRDRLIDSASQLFHRFGVSNTSLADIAKHADIPIGNVYYYFKTKEELAVAALARREQEWRELHRKLAATVEDPRQRIVQAVHHFDNVREEYALYGCPFGKVIADSAPEKDAVARAAAHVFAQSLDWMETQFELLGHQASARRYALFVFTSLQGAAVMAKAFAAPHIISDEINRLVEWVGSLPNRKIFLGKAAPAAALAQAES